MGKEYDVLVVVEVENLEDKTSFDKHLRREGLKEIEGEEFAYIGKASTPLLNTMAFVQDAVKKALKKGKDFNECKMAMWLGESGPKSFVYNKTEEEFKEVIEDIS